MWVVYDQANNYMYISDCYNGRIQRWTPGASYGTTIIGPILNYPRGIFMHSSGNLIVADQNNHRIVSFAVYCRKHSFIHLKNIMN